MFTNGLLFAANNEIGVVRGMWFSSVYSANGTAGKVK